MTTAYYRHKYCPDTSYLRPKYIYIPKTPVRKFFESLIPPQIIDSEKWTDLHLAVGYKNLELVQAVCNKHNINIKDAKGRTALELAILGDNLEIVQFLVQNGGVVAPNNMYGWSAIHLAIKVGNLDIVKYLYENTKFNEHDKYGLTLQNWAEKVGNEQIQNFFFDRNHNNNKTPLELAVESKNISSIKTLISKGAKFDIKSDLGYQIFNLAIDSRSISLIEYLTNKFLNLNSKQTLLEKIVQIHDKKINITKLAKTLIEKSDCTKIDNTIGQKLLIKAAYANDLDLVKALHDKGVKLGTKDLLGRTSLHHAIKAGAGKDLIEFLIDNAGIDINACDKSGSTLMHWAVNSHHIPAIKLLQTKKADYFTPDYLGQTPLKLAEYYGHDDVIELLAENSSAGYYV